LADISNAFSTLDDNDSIQCRASVHSWLLPSTQDHEGQPSFPQSSVQDMRILSESIVSAIHMNTAHTTSDKGDTVPEHHDGDDKSSAASQRLSAQLQGTHTLSHLIKKVGAVTECLLKLRLAPRGYDVCKIVMVMIISVILYCLCVTIINILQVDQVIV
jgi:hypothetical protein